MKTSWLIVVASGRREYRESALRSVAAAFRVLLIVSDEPSWQVPLVESVTRLEQTDPTSAIAAARRLAADHDVAGVLCWDEAHVHLAGAIVDALDLPGVGTATIALCRDKLLQRQALESAGVAQPRFAATATADEAATAAAAIGYPVVLKPRSAAASLGVIVVEDEADLRRQFDYTATARISTSAPNDRPVLVEQLLDDAEISVDSVVQDGIVTAVTVAHKKLAYPPYFEEIGHVVDAHDPLLQDPGLAETLHRIHEALGFFWGWTHTELKLTSAGPAVIEVNARVAGDLIPELAAATSGVDLPLLAARAAVREHVDVQDHVRVEADRRVAANRFYYSPVGGVTATSVHFDSSRLPREALTTILLVGPGDRLDLPPEGLFSGRVAVAICAGPDIDTVESALTRAGEALALQTV